MLTICKKLIENIAAKKVWFSVVNRKIPSQFVFFLCQTNEKRRNKEKKKMMKILVFGHRGWIGNQFCELVKSRNDDDVTTTIVFAESCPGKEGVPEQSVEDEIRRVMPTHVIMFIGRTHGPGCGTIDYIEDKLALNMRDNLYAPLTICNLCRKVSKDIHVTYLGTGCIFEYESEDYSDSKKEDDLPNFFGSGYSTVKGYTDRLMHQMDDFVLNLRIRMPINYEMHPRNFITKITSYSKVVNIPNSMTVLPQLLPKVFEMMKMRTTGTINLTQPGVISHNEILELYRDIVDPTFTWENFTIDEQDEILKAKRSNCFLDASKLKSLFPDVEEVHDSMRIVMEKLKQNSQAN